MYLSFSNSLRTYVNVVTNYSVSKTKYANKGGFFTDIWRTNYAQNLERVAQKLYEYTSYLDDNNLGCLRQ